MKWVREYRGYPMWGWIVFAAIVAFLAWYALAGGSEPCANSTLPYDECIERYADWKQAQRP